MKKSRAAGARVTVGAVLAVLLASTAVSPLAAQTMIQDVKTALEEARKAREEAAEALRRADEAVAKAQKSLESIEALTGGAKLTSTPAQSIAPTDDEPKPAYADRAACGDTGTAGRILMADQRVFASGTEGRGGLNWFSAACLGMSRYQDFTTDAAVQFTGTKGEAVIEAGPVVTWRRLKPSGNGSFRSVYHTGRLQVFGSLGDDGNASLFDIDKFEFQSGFGFKLGYEYGRGKRQTRGKLEKGINDALAQARRDCIARYGVTDPLNLQPGETEVGYRSLAAAVASCEGEKLAEFMSGDGRKLDYWKKIVRPLWGYDQDPVWFVGGELSYAWTDFSYYPIYDAATKGLLLTTLPNKFLDGGGETEDSKQPFAVQIYTGFSHGFETGLLNEGSIGGALGLTYRREYAIPGGYKDQQVCLPPSVGEGDDKVTALFSQCRKINTAAPYEAEGFVASLAVRFQLPRYAFLPPIAFTVKPSYAFDLDRWGVEVPIYLFNDNEGKLSSGVKVTCRGDGRTRSGIELKDECGAALFVGTKFKIGGAP